MHHIVIKNTAQVLDVIFFLFLFFFGQRENTASRGWTLLVCLVRESDNRTSLLTTFINGCFRYATEPVDAKKGGIPQMFYVLFLFFYFRLLGRLSIVVWPIRFFFSLLTPPLEYYLALNF